MLENEQKEVHNFFNEMQVRGFGVGLVLKPKKSLKRRYYVAIIHHQKLFYNNEMINFKYDMLQIYTHHQLYIHI